MPDKIPISVIQVGSLFVGFIASLVVKHQAVFIVYRIHGF